MTRDGNQCVETVTAHGRWLDPRGQRVFQVRTRAGAQPCTARHPDALTPAELAEEFWYLIRLPFPRPFSRPDFATTGKTTYLQAGDTSTPRSWSRATPLGELVITAHGSFTVDWGDGTPATGPYANPGGPYPDGTITHTYDTTGVVEITVKELWTADWTIGAAHGTLTALHTIGTIPRFPIDQLQAVITG